MLERGANLVLWLTGCHWIGQLCFRSLAEFGNRRLYRQLHRLNGLELSEEFISLNTASNRVPIGLAPNLSVAPWASFGSMLMVYMRRLAIIQTGGQLVIARVTIFSRGCLSLHFASNA